MKGLAYIGVDTMSRLEYDTDLRSECHGMAVDIETLRQNRILATLPDVEFQPLGQKADRVGIGVRL